MKPTHQFKFVVIGETRGVWECRKCGAWATTGALYAPGWGKWGPCPFGTDGALTGMEAQP